MLSVRGSRELQAVVLAMRSARRDVRNDVNRATRQTLNPVWRAEVAERARTPLDRKVIAQGARILSGNPPVMVAATSTRKLKGGLVPARDFHGVEFGANQGKETTYTRTSKKGTAHKVTRHTSRQLPARVTKGRVAWPAVAEMGPRYASLWVQTIVRTFNEAVEKGAGT